MQGKEAVYGPQESTDVQTILGDVFDMKCFRTAAYTLFNEDETNEVEYEIFASDDGGVTWDNFNSGYLSPGEMISETLQTAEWDIIRHTHLKIEIVSLIPGTPAAARCVFYAFP